MTEKQKLYKLTTTEHRTHGGTLWGRGVTHEATGTGGLCTDGVIHAYENDPRVGLLMNPLHGDIQEPVVWLAEGVVTHRDGPLKCGCRSLTTIRVICTPKMTREQVVEIVIRYAMSACEDVPEWTAWAERWMSGEDRSRESARAAEDAAAGPTDMGAIVNMGAVRATRAALALLAEGWVTETAAWSVFSVWTGRVRVEADLPAIIRRVCGELDTKE